ncbi:MAG: DUF5678 domain-containing protein [archaeon]
MDSQVLQEFNVLETGSSFLSKNFATLRKDYADRYVALEGNKILANASSFEELVKLIHSMGKRLSDVLIEFIPSKGQIVVY